MAEKFSFKDEIEYFHKEKELKDLIVSSKAKIEILSVLISVLESKVEDENIKKTVTKYKNEIRKLKNNIPETEKELEEHKKKLGSFVEHDKKKEPLPEKINQRSSFVMEMVKDFEKLENISISSSTKHEVVVSEIRRMNKYANSSLVVDEYIEFLCSLEKKLEETANADYEAKRNQDNQTLKAIDGLICMIDRHDKGLPEIDSEIEK